MWPFSKKKDDDIGEINPPPDQVERRWGQHPVKLVKVTTANGYTEIYKTDTSTLGNVLDFFGN